jgi:hypothetical protein
MNAKLNRTGWEKHGAVFYRSLLCITVPLDRFHFENDGRGEEMKK